MPQVMTACPIAACYASLVASDTGDKRSLEDKAWTLVAFKQHKWKLVAFKKHIWARRHVHFVQWQLEVAVEVLL